MRMRREPAMGTAPRPSMHANLRRGSPYIQIAKPRLRFLALSRLFSPMRSRVFRASTVTVALVFAQFAVVTGGVCTGGMEDMASMASMPGMTAPLAHEHAPPPPDSHQHAPCSHHTSQSECSSMSACGIPVMAVSVVRGSTTPAAQAATRVVQVSAPRSVSRAPEPPPPRA